MIFFCLKKCFYLIFIFLINVVYEIQLCNIDIFVIELGKIIYYDLSHRKKKNNVIYNFISK